jgi:protein-tyrosine-phosphatase
MARSYYNHLTGTQDADSAGTEVEISGETLDERKQRRGGTFTIEAMSEENIDVSSNVMIQVTPEMLDGYEKIICMAQEEHTPDWLTQSPKFIRWDVEDPGGKGLAETVTARAVIKARVVELIKPAHIVIFSHGFGVYSDDRGLFPDIIKYLPSAKTIMFEYNRSDKTSHTLFASTLEEQVVKLRSTYEEARATNPAATIDLICHSQGCIIAAMAQLEGVRKTIFLAPPDDGFGRNIDEKLEDMLVRKMRPGTKTLEDGSISYPRRDGSTTVIPMAYWDSRRGVSPVQLYNTMASRTELTILKATNDEVIGDTDFASLLTSIEVVEIDTGHDFEGQTRTDIGGLIQRRLAA